MELHKQDKPYDMVEPLFSNAYLELCEDNKEYYLRINGVFEVQVSAKQMLDLLEIAKESRELEEKP